MCRVKVDWRSSQKSNYKDFKEKHPSISVSYEDWIKIIYAFNESIRDYIIETGDKVRFPNGIGDITIKKKKRKTFKTTSSGKTIVNLPIDWVKSKQQRKTIYIMNHHTDGYFFGWIWFRASSKLRMAKLWKFKSGRVASRLLAHYLKSNEKYQNIYRDWQSKF